MNFTSELNSYFSTFKANAPLVITPEVRAAAQSIAFNPLFWNVVGRVESKSHVFSRLAGSKYRACYIFAAIVFSLGIFRDYLYYQALQSQPIAPLLNNDFARLTGIVIAAVGHSFVVSSMWSLGVTGTYLGDYFGILMDHKVECFPFNVVNNPMYTGSFLSFLGVALHQGKAVGVGLSLLVFLIYRVGLLLEEPFTARIYQQKEKID